MGFKVPSNRNHSKILSVTGTHQWYSLVQPKMMSRAGEEPHLCRGEQSWLGHTEPGTLQALPHTGSGTALHPCSHTPRVRARALSG